MRVCVCTWHLRLLQPRGECEEWEVLLGREGLGELQIAGHGTFLLRQCIHCKNQVPILIRCPEYLKPWIACKKKIYKQIKTHIQLMISSIMFSYAHNGRRCLSEYWWATVPQIEIVTYTYIYIYIPGESILCWGTEQHSFHSILGDILN